MQQGCPGLQTEPAPSTWQHQRKARLLNKNPGAAFAGLFFGIFLGSWIIALGEVVNAFAIAASHLGLKEGARLIILSIAFGKTLGSLLQFCV